MAALDSNILGLMNQTVAWESSTGNDLYADHTYAASKNKLCFVEEKGLMGGMMGVRRPDDRVADTEIVLYFDANDADVQTFKLGDRFTVTGIETAGVARNKPSAINIFVGAQGEPWIKTVTL